MVGQLRIYKINDGQMEAWLKHFDSLIPIMAKAQITVQGSRVGPEENSFGWIRTFDDDDLEAGEAGFYGSAEWEAVKKKTGSYVASGDITVIEFRWQRDGFRGRAAARG